MMDAVRPFDKVMDEISKEGGERFWTETIADERSSNMRVEEAVETGAEGLVMGCPFCVLNLEDSAKSMGKEEQAVVRDVVEILD